MRARLAIGVLAVLSALVRAEPTDPPADYLVDISELAGEPCGIRVKTDRMYWQLAAEQLRRGYGIGLFSILRNTTNNCEARIYVEVEAIGDAGLDAAVDRAIADLPAILDAHQTQVEGEIDRDKKAEYKIGSTKVEGVKVRYSVKVLNANPVTTDPATALMFQHKGALVTVTVENYASSTVDHFSRFLKTLSIEKLPVKGGKWRLKMVDAAGGSYRYFEMPVLPDMAPERSDRIEGNAVGFVHTEKGAPLVRMRVAKSELGRPMEEKEEAEYRHSSLLDMYKSMSKLEEIAIGEHKAWLCTGFDDAVTPPRRIAVLYFRPHGVMWTWTLESMDADEKKFAKDMADFRAALKKLQYWFAAPR